MVDHGVDPQAGRGQAVLAGQPQAGEGKPRHLRLMPERLGVDEDAVHVEDHGPQHGRGGYNKGGEWIG